MNKTILLLAIISSSSINFLAGQNGNLIFSDAIIHEIRLDNIDTTSFFLFVNKGVYSSCKITIDGTTIDSIGAATKGNISWGHPNLKKPIKIDLNKYVGGKKYDGIKKFYLHNSFEDPSLMREKLTYDICHQMGLHALRTAFAKVYINNVYWGVYTLIEAKDELYKRDFENKNAEVFETFDFGSPCTFSQDNIYWAVDNGTPAPTWPRLNVMANKLSNTPISEFLDTMPKYFNITDFFNYQAVNVYLLNFDSYLQFNGNQLYLFDSIVENRFQIIPWDFNASFGLWNTNSYNPNTLDVLPDLITTKCPFDRINLIPALNNIYLEAICKLKNSYCDTILLNSKITGFYNQIKSAVHSDNRKDFSSAQFDIGANYGYQSLGSDNVPGLKTFVNERWTKINADLQALSYNCNVTGISPIALPSNYSLAFPNPVKEVLFIKGENKGNRFELINMLGQTKRSEFITTSENFEVNTADLNAGIYWLVISDIKGTREVLKIIKE